MGWGTLKKMMFGWEVKLYRFLPLLDPVDRLSDLPQARSTLCDAGHPGPGRRSGRPSCEQDLEDSRGVERGSGYLEKCS